MGRQDAERLDDIALAISALRRHLARGSITEEVIFDAVRMRLIEIGEAVKGLSAEAKSREPDIPWRQIAGMRDRLTHRNFQSEKQIVQGTIERDIEALAAAIERLVQWLED